MNVMLESAVADSGRLKEMELAYSAEDGISSTSRRIVS